MNLTFWDVESSLVGHIRMGRINGIGIVTSSDYQNLLQAQIQHMHRKGWFFTIELIINALNIAQSGQHLANLFDLLQRRGKSATRLTSPPILPWNVDDGQSHLPSRIWWWNLIALLVHLNCDHVKWASCWSTLTTTFHLVMRNELASWGRLSLPPFHPPGVRVRTHFADALAIYLVV